MHLFRYPMESWWEEVAVILLVGYVAGYYFESFGAGLLTDGIGFLILLFRWAHFFYETYPEKAKLEEKMQYAHAAHCMLAAQLSAGCAAFSLTWLVLRMLPIAYHQLSPYVWLRPWILVGLAILAITAKAYQFHKVSIGIKY